LFDKPLSISIIWILNVPPALFLFWLGIELRMGKIRALCILTLVGSIHLALNVVMVACIILGTIASERLSSSMTNLGLVLLIYMPPIVIGFKHRSCFH
jgi:hypothetical protein